MLVYQFFIFLRGWRVIVRNFFLRCGRVIVRNFFSLGLGGASGASLHDPDLKVKHLKSVISGGRFYVLYIHFFY